MKSILLRTLAIVQALFVVIGGASCAAAEPAVAPASMAELDAFITKALAQYRVPGAAVAVIEDGKVVLVKGYGVRDNTRPGAVDGDTVFQIASISKTFTATLAATLVDEGKLAWDTPITAYLPEFATFDPYPTRWMTMRDLLAQRTGWPKFTGDKLDDFGYDRAEILRRLRYLKPAYSLRDVSQYSNPGFFVAGEVEARVGGASWNALMRQRVLDPLHMTRSGASVRDLADANSAVGHAVEDGRVVPTAASDQDTMGAAGSITSTAADLARYMQLVLGNGDDARLLRRETVAGMFARSMVGEIEFSELPPVNERTGFFYGLGFDSFDYAGHQIVGKGGALAGVRSLLALIPDENAGIVILANLNVTAFPEAVRAFWLERRLGHSPKADLAEIASRNDKLQALFAPQTPPAHPGPFGYPLASVVGAYENDLYGRCEIALARSQLSLACGPARFSAPLRHWDNGQFALHWPGATNGVDDITFSIGADGTADSFTDDALGVFTRIRPPK